MGPDDIPSRVLKSCYNAGSIFMFVLFEKFLSECDLPVDLKCARVIALQKSSPKNNVENYRPISLTSICCKAMKHIMLQIIYRLSMFNILTRFQRGFRRGHSCVTWLNLHMICP